jgi:hypothetical protein
MKPKILLRIASIVMILHDVGHMIGSLTWKQAVEPEKQQVIDQMTGHKFPFMGAMRSMGDYYDGYGFASALAILLIAIVLWIVSSSLTQDPRLAKKLLITISATLLAWGINELIFFFPFAAAFSLLAMALTFIAILQLNAGTK